MLIWVLIYGGLFAVGLGVALERTGASYGSVSIGAGAVLPSRIGCVLIWFRSRLATR